MKYIQIYFRNRAKPVTFPVPDQDSERMCKLSTDRSDCLGFIEVGTIVGHSVWINTEHIQIVRFLFETDMPPYLVSDLAPSTQYPESEEDYESIDLEQASWDVDFWVQGMETPLSVTSVSGHDWVEVYTSCECAEQFLVITDEDDEQLAIKVADVQMIAGLEIERYSLEQHEIARSIIV